MTVLTMNDRVGTRSFAKDSFPIELSQIKAGDLYTEPGTHSYAITGITDTGVTAIMSSTTPASPKNMTQLYSYPFFIPHDKINETDGYRRFKWPRFINKPAKQHAGYSSEQYEIAEKVGQDYVPFTDIIAKKLRRREEPLEEKTMRLMHSLCSFAKERVNYVNDGIKKIIFHPELPDGLLDQLDKFCGLAIYPDDDKKHINLRQLWEVMLADKLSSDPHAPFDSRWGLSDTKFVGSCPTF